MTPQMTIAELDAAVAGWLSQFLGDDLVPEVALVAAATRDCIPPDSLRRVRSAACREVASQSGARYVKLLWRGCYADHGLERSCADCIHRLPRGSCAHPEAAGLFPPGHGFGIAFVEAGHAAVCPAFAKDVLAEAAVRDDESASRDGDVAHASVLGDADHARFRVFVDALLQRGFPEEDAKNLAVRLRDRDLAGDKRRLCVECGSLDGAGRCGSYRLAGLGGPEVGRDLATTLQRCPAFEGAPGMPAAPSMPSEA